MRMHLIKSFESGKMTPFPGRDLLQQQEAILKTVKIRIYCSCRMPQLGMDKMAQCIVCQELYHQQCENIPKEVFVRKNRLPFVCKCCK